MGQRIDELERISGNNLAFIGESTTLVSLYTAFGWDKDFKYTLAVAFTLIAVSLGSLLTIYKTIDKKLLGAYGPFQINLKNKVINEEI